MSGEQARRWRLVLGRYAEGELPRDSGDTAVDETLGYLYDREYIGRGHRHAKGAGGSLDPTALKALNWLGKAHGLFPQSTLERLQADAVTRYGLDDLLADQATVAALGPNQHLTAALMRMKGRLSPDAANGLRALIAQVVADIVKRLRPQFVTALTGSRDRFRRTPHASSANFDWKRTIAANLANVDPATGRMLVDQVRFAARKRRNNLHWDVIVLVDQSGSMAASLLHAAVSASILAGLPGVSVRLILFDTSLVDLSHLASDPVEVLLTAQLGGGTNIAQAMKHVETLVSQPTRTVVALISDFEEGGSVSALLASVRRLAGSGVTMLGLAALSDEGEPWYDRTCAARLVGAGMPVAAMTPDRFAEWLAEVMV